jgi:uncharacterized protein involved in response to NO
MTTISARGHVAKRAGLPLFSAGFRPFFLLGAAWSAIAVPVWLAAYLHGYAPSAMPAMLWHAHEMIYGYGVAAVAGFLLTAIPNWTGRLPLSGGRLAGLAALWLAGRVALLLSAGLGAPVTMLVDLSFLAVLMLAIARELIAGRNYRNLPMLAALGLLFAGSLLVHLQALELAYTAALGNRVGIATLCALIALVGGRIVPSFTRNWLAKQGPRAKLPAPESAFDRATLLITFAGLACWVLDFTPAVLVLAGVLLAVRLARWRGLATLREPLVVILHVGYAWLALALILIGLEVPAALHALTVGAIGTMTLAVMTRASLGHTGRALAADPATIAIYVLITLAALLRVTGSQSPILLSLAGLAWCAAFATFVLHYAPFLIREKTP